MDTIVGLVENKIFLFFLFSFGREVLGTAGSNWFLTLKMELKSGISYIYTVC